MSTPLIGISSAWSRHEIENHDPQKDAYVIAIERLCAQAVYIPTDLSPRALKELIATLSGILLRGGGDIDPSRYGVIPSKLTHLKEIKPERDALEFTLVQFALKQHIPTLGICRGIQIMNAALGGTLYQDLAAELTDSFAHDQHFYDDSTKKPRDLLIHRVTLTPGSQLHAIYAQDEIRVNSLHHQGIHRLARRLTAAGRTPEDGLIEAVEMPTHPFFLGVQWHPEELAEHPEHQCIFRAFVEKASSFRQP